MARASQPAGLPLCAELFGEIVELAKVRGFYTNILKRDIEAFLEYLRRSKGITITEDEINFEEFIPYLDVEHFLQLKGSDHWSSEGNLSQLVIRNLIAIILHAAESAMSDKDFELYEQFAERLEPGDIIISFNYDTIVEQALFRKSVPYRLFPTRYKTVGFAGGEVLDTDEIVLLKMHGSVNWSDITVYDKHPKGFREQAVYVRPDTKCLLNKKSCFF